MLKDLEAKDLALRASPTKLPNRDDGGSFWAQSPIHPVQGIQFR